MRQRERTILTETGTDCVYVCGCVGDRKSERDSGRDDRTVILILE